MFSFIKSHKPARNERSEAERYIRDFLDGTGGDYDWDDFISASFDDPEVEAIRQFCASTDGLFPRIEGGWCKDDGIRAMRSIQQRLKRALDSE